MPVVIAALVVLLGAGAAAPRDVNAVSVAAGDYHSCALTETSEVKCWGDNTSGELGDGTSIQRSTPVPVAGLRGRVVAISVGGVHSCALEDSGTVECWGWNAAGQLGIGPGPDRLQPVTVRDLGPAAAVAAGGEHTCALTTGGGVKCWGHNNFGGLGDGTTTARTSPVGVAGLASGVKVVAAGRHFSCGLTLGGAAKCWGLNESGQLGDGTSQNRSSPVDVVGLDGGVTAITAMANHACALLESGIVKCWGANQSGELGDGSRTDSWVPVDVKGISDAVALASGGRHAGGGHTCALKAGGEALCWGSNRYGQLGDGTTVSRSTPVAVQGLHDAVALAAGGYHTCALTRSLVKCWGWNRAGQLGDGSTADRSTPVDVIEREIRDCLVPRMIGSRLRQAKAKLAAAHCGAGKVTKRYSARRKGRVIAQSVRPGTRAAAGTKVSLILSKGRRPHR